MNDFNLKNIKSEFKNKGIFYTPPELGEYLKSLIDIEYNEVYDPTCGHGSLLTELGANIDIEGKIKRRKRFLREFEKEFMEAERTGTVKYKTYELKLF